MSQVSQESQHAASREVRGDGIAVSMWSRRRAANAAASWCWAGEWRKRPSVATVRAGS